MRVRQPRVSVRRRRCTNARKAKATRQNAAASRRGAEFEQRRQSLGSSGSRSAPLPSLIKHTSMETVAMEMVH